MSTDKSLGQIAFEAYEERFSVHLRQRWADNPQHDAWNEAGETIAAEVRRRDGEKQLPLIPKPEWVLSPYESVAAMAMQGLCSQPNVIAFPAYGDGDEIKLEHRGWNMSPCKIANMAFDMADAFFAEASKRRNKC